MRAHLLVCNMVEGDKTMKFVIFQGYDKQWYWRAVARNGRIIADGAEGYASKSNAKRAIWRVVDLMRVPTGRIKVVE